MFLTKLIIRLLIPNWKNTESPAVRERYGKVSGLVGVVTNLLLAILKLVTGLIFNSIAIMADAANNFSDSASSVVTLIGFKLSGLLQNKIKSKSAGRVQSIALRMICDREKEIRAFKAEFQDKEGSLLYCSPEPDVCPDCRGDTSLSADDEMESHKLPFQPHTHECDIQSCIHSPAA